MITAFDNNTGVSHSGDGLTGVTEGTGTGKKREVIKS